MLRGAPIRTQLREYQVLTGSTASIHPTIRLTVTFQRNATSSLLDAFDLKLSDPHPIGVLPGVGVTAYDEEDALRMIRERIFTRHPFPQVKEQIMDVDVSTLDDRHVRPNMGNPMVRGVWFPQGYQ